jgi:hypothetical protein
MDLDLREAFHHGFGPEPPHPPVSERIEAGHLAVRHRRAVGTILTVAVATVVGLGTVAVLADGSNGTSPVATEETPTSSPTPEAAGWPGKRVVRIDDEGAVQIRPGATVLDRVDDPLPGADATHRSVAVAVTYEGEETWHLITWEGFPQGSASGENASGPGQAWDTFRDWVADQVRTAEPPLQDQDLVTFGDGSTLVAAPGVTIEQQTAHPDLPENFAPAGSRTAVALVRLDDGTRVWVLARDVDGFDTIPFPITARTDTLGKFLAFARTKYGEGVGLR